jgi:hypothetical protein
MDRKLIIDEEKLDMVAFRLAIEHHLSAVPEQPYSRFRELLYGKIEEGAQFYEHLQTISEVLGEEARAWYIFEDTNAEFAVQSIENLEKSIILTMKRVADNSENFKEAN